MNIQQLPLELVRTILAEAMMARGLRRALRLRLVNRFFSIEVLELLGELRMLDDVEVYVSQTGHIGSAYLSQRLLSKQTSLSPRLDNMRQIASRLAREDPNTDRTEGYAEYIRTLSSLIVSSCSRFMSQLFLPDPMAEKSGVLEYDFLAAAVYLGKFSIVQELSARAQNTNFGIGTLRNPYLAAAFTGDTVIIDLLLKQAVLHGRGPRGILLYQLQTASNAGLARTVEHLLASEFNPGLGREGHPYFENFHEALSTPDIETFDILMRFKEATPYKTLTKAQLAFLLYKAAENGWESMAARLLDMGAPTGGHHFGQSDESMPLLAACKSGSEGVVRLLLQRYAKITGLEIGAAARKGRLGTVRILLEHGAKSNLTVPLPIVSAVKLEYKELFHLLMEHGAELGEAGVTAAKEAWEAGLASMLTLLEQHGVKIGDGLVTKN